jgi:hypothetical protein
MAKEAIMSDSDIPVFDLLLTRAIAKLYASHPATVTLGSYELWEPALTKTTADFEQKVKDADGTLLWLYRNSLVGGELADFGGTVVINQAQLTAHGLRIARKVDANTGGIALGQVAVEAASKAPLQKSVVDLVARRFIDG